MSESKQPTIHHQRLRRGFTSGAGFLRSPPGPNFQADDFVKVCWESPPVGGGPFHKGVSEHTERCRWLGTQSQSLIWNYLHYLVAAFGTTVIQMLT